MIISIRRRAITHNQDRNELPAGAVPKAGVAAAEPPKENEPAPDAGADPKPPLVFPNPPNDIAKIFQRQVL